MSACPSCGTAVPEGSRFCGSCGAEVRSAADPPLPGESSARARERAMRIRAFRAELAELERAGVLRLRSGERAAVERHHAQVLETADLGVGLDLDEPGAHLALGLRAVSLIGTLALAASAFYFFYRIWGVISPALQVAVVAAAPLLALCVTAVIAPRDRSRYFTGLAALFALACLVVNVVMLHGIFDLSPSVVSLLACGLFAVTLAWGYRLNLQLVLGSAALAWFVAGVINHWTGSHWGNAPQRPENFLPGACLLIAAGVLGIRWRLPGSPPIYRAVGVVLLLFPVVLLSAVGWLSYLPWSRETIETVYQVLGFVLGAGVVWLGIARRWKEWIYGGALFVVVLLYLKFVDWFWDWMPRYLFFLVVALTAVGSALVLRRLRTMAASAPAGERP